MISSRIRVVNDEWELHMFREVATLLDLRVSILRDPCLGPDPKGVDKVGCITLSVQVMVFPKGFKPRETLDVHWLTASLRVPQGSILNSAK